MAEQRLNGLAHQELPKSLQRKFGPSQFVAGLFRWLLRILHYPK